MNKKQSVFILIIFLVGFVIASIYPSLKEPITLNNFPLRERWSTKLPGEINQISLANKDLLIVRTSQVLVALDLKNQNVAWRRDINYQAITQPPLANNDTVFVADGKGIWSIRTVDGEINWSQPAEYPESVAVIAVSDDFVAVNDGSYLKVFNAHSGELLFDKMICRNTIQPKIIGDKIYVPCNGITAITITTGEVEWEQKSDDRIWAAGYQDNVLYSTPDFEHISATNLETREVLWNSNFPNDRIREYLIAENSIFITDPPNLCSIRQLDGKINWCTKRINNPRNPTILGDTLFIFDGSQTTISAIDTFQGNYIGKVVLSRLSFFAVSKKLMLSIQDQLIVSNGNTIISFGK